MSDANIPIHGLLRNQRSTPNHSPARYSVRKIMYTYTSQLAVAMRLAIGHTYPSANNELVISDTNSIVFRAEDQFLGFKGSLASTSELE